jgi:hypothetical protein
MKEFSRKIGHRIEGKVAEPGKVFKNTARFAAKWGKHPIHFFSISQDNCIALIWEPFGDCRMDALMIKNELRKMRRRNLLKLVTNQKISNCLIAGTACGLHLRYKTFTFCASEIMGQSCQLQKLKKLEEAYQGSKAVDRLLSFAQGIEKEDISFEKEAAEFRVYYRDHLTRSVILLGKVMERRRKERGNNLSDLLNKAIMDYSTIAKDPSAIFLLGS